MHLKKTIEKSIYVRAPPRGKKRFCGVKLNEGCGGITKSFNTLAELAEHIYSEFGEGWKNMIQCKKTQEPPQHQRQETKPLSKETKPQTAKKKQQEETACLKLYHEHYQKQTIGK